MNKVILIGRVSRDPIFGSTAKGMSVLNLDIETIEKWIDKDGSSKNKRTFIRSVIWGRNAELTRDIVKKNDLVAIEGSLSVSSKESDGKKEYKTEVKIQIIEVMNERTIEKDYPIDTSF